MWEAVAVGDVDFEHVVADDIDVDAAVAGGAHVEEG